MPLKRSNNKHLSNEKGRDLRKAIRDQDVDAISWILLEVSIRELQEGEDITLGRAFISSMLSQLRSQSKSDESRGLHSMPTMAEVEEVESWLAAK